MKRIHALCLMFALLSCGRNPSKKSDYDNIIDNEIANRHEMIAVLQIDSSKAKLCTLFSAIQYEVSNLILLTKDVENADAVIKKVNDYFHVSVLKYKIPDEGFVIVTKTMSLPAIETTIKTNQLNLLDKIIFANLKLSSDSTELGSVY